MNTLGVICSSMIFVAVFALMMIAHPPTPWWLAWVPWEGVILAAFGVIVVCVGIAWWSERGAGVSTVPPQEPRE